MSCEQGIEQIQKKVYSWKSLDHELFINCVSSNLNHCDRGNTQETVEITSCLKRAADQAVPLKL